MIPPLLASIVLIGSLLCFSANGSSRQSALTENEKRQVSPTPHMNEPLLVIPTSTSTFDYWWPYSPATASGAQLVTPVFPDAEETDFPKADENLSITSTTFTDLISPSQSDATMAVDTSSGAGLSKDGSSTSSLFMTITALPPLTSPFLHPHAISAYRQPTNPFVFMPLFVISGLAAGLSCGWYGYGYWKRRKNLHRDVVIAGPKYEGIGREDVDDRAKVSEKNLGAASCRVETEEQLSQAPHLHIDGNETYDGTHELNQPGTHKAGSAWYRVSSLMSQRTPLLSGHVNSHATPEGNIGDTQDRHAERLRSPFAPAVFSSVVSSDEDDEDYEDARHFADKGGTEWHKSIRRRIAEKLRLQINPGYNFARKPRTPIRKTRGKTPELEQGVLLQDDSLMVDSPATPEKGSLKRSKRRYTSHGRAISNFSVLPDDIQTPPRIYALKDPGVTPLDASSPQKIRTRTYSTPLKSGDNSGFDDKYTPLPSRKAKSGHRLTSSRSMKKRTEILADASAPPKFHMQMDLNRRVLPTSPPLLNSSELESALFFSPSVESTNRDLSLSYSAARENTGQRASTHYEMDSRERGSPVRKAPLGPRHSKKLLSKHSATQGLDTSPARPRPFDEILAPVPLHRSIARDKSVSPTKGRYSSLATKHDQEQSNTLCSTPAFVHPTQRHEARCAALKRVDAIVERSWSARLLQASATPPN